MYVLSDHTYLPTYLQSFDLWKTANPDVHKLIIESLGSAVAISDKGGNESQLAAQELNLRRFQFAGITR